MNTGRRQALRLAAGMGGAATLAAALRWAPDGAAPRAEVQLDSMVPERIGEWHVDREAASFVRAADRRGQQTGLYDQVLERSFVAGSTHHVMLSVAYLGAQSSDLQLHLPEVCYRAGGFRVGELRAGQLDVAGRRLPVTRLFAQMPGRPEPVTYWAVVDGRAVGVAGATWEDRLRRALRRGRRAEGLLVRISSIDAEVEAAWQLHDRFAQALAGTLPAGHRDFVLGSPHPA